MKNTVATAYSRGNGGASLADTSEVNYVRVLLGARAGCKLTEDTIDSAFKRFLRKAWKTRRKITHAINVEFGRQDIEWARGNGGVKPLAMTHKKQDTIEHTRQKTTKGREKEVEALHYVAQQDTVKCDVEVNEREAAVTCDEREVKSVHGIAQSQYPSVRRGPRRRLFD